MRSHAFSSLLFDMCEFGDEGEGGMTQYLDWKVGDKVVCVNDRLVTKVRRKGWFERFRPWTIVGHNLNAGDVYTIAWIGRCTFHDDSERVCVRVNEAWHFGYSRVPFPAEIFRPVQTRKADISIFTAMLHDRRQSVPA